MDENVYPNKVIGIFITVIAASKNGLIALIRTPLRKIVNVLQLPHKKGDLLWKTKTRKSRILAKKKRTVYVIYF